MTDLKQGDLVTFDRMMIVSSFLGNFPLIQSSVYTGRYPPRWQIEAKTPGIVVSPALETIDDIALILIDGKIAASWKSNLKVVRSIDD